MPDAQGTVVKRHPRPSSLGIVRAFFERFIAVDVFTQAASLSFYALLSLAPLLILLLWLITSIYPSAEKPLVWQVNEYAGDAAANVAMTVLQNATQQSTLGSKVSIWGTLLLLIGATAVFAQLQSAFNLIFRNPTQHTSGLLALLKKRIFSLGMLITLGFLLLLSIVAMTTLQIAFTYLPILLPMAGHLTSFAIYTVTFALLYRYLPDRVIGWRHAFLGAVMTAFLFAIGRYAIGVYIAKATPGSAYGSMGALVILLVWMYYASVILLIGAILTAVIDEHYKTLASVASTASSKT